MGVERDLQEAEQFCARHPRFELGVQSLLEFHLRRIGDVVSVSDLHSLGHTGRARRIVERDCRGLQFLRTQFPPRILGRRTLVRHQRRPVPHGAQIPPPALKRRDTIIKSKDPRLLDADLLRGIQSSSKTALRGDEEASARVTQLVRQFPSDVGGVSAGEDAAGHDGADKDDGEEDCVSGKEQHAIAALQSRALEAEREPLAPEPVAGRGQEVRVGESGVYE